MKQKDEENMQGIKHYTPQYNQPTLQNRGTKKNNSWNSLLCKYIHEGISWSTYMSKIHLQRSNQMSYLHNGIVKFSRGSFEEETH